MTCLQACSQAAARTLIENERIRNLRLLSLAGELGLRDFKRVIANTALFVGASGSLMQLAHTTPTSSANYRR